MRKKWWHWLLSYVKDVYLESTSSEYNRELHIILNSGRYQLCTSNAVYSFEDKYLNFRRSFEWINWEKENIQNVLVLGLGLGSVPQMLEQVFKQEFDYHAVEIDEVIIELAHRYVLNELKSPIQIFQADALHFVKVCSSRYDLIIMDIFEDDKVPTAFESREFLDDVSNLLNDGGALLFNRLNLSQQDHDDTSHYYENVFKAFFPDASCSSIEGNYMLNSRKALFGLQNS